MRDPIRLRSPFILRARGGGSPPTPTFDPASLFLNPLTDAGFILDVATDHMWNGQSGYKHASAGQSVREALSRYYQIGSYEPGSSDPGVAIFVQDTATKRPVFQAEGALRYLQFDGVDDWMSLASLDMGGADAVTVIAGMRRGQNVNNEELFSISLNAQNNVANPGAFVMSPTVDAGTNNAGFSSQGGGTFAIARASSSSIGVDYVLTGIGDISADTCIVRRNGAQLGSDAADQGATSYGNYAAYLGARGGLSRYCNIRLYALIVINRVLTATELAAAEKWIGAKCGVAL